MIKSVLPGLALIAIGSIFVLAPMFLPIAIFGDFAGDKGLNLVAVMIVGAIIAAGGILGTIVSLAMHALRRKISENSECQSS